MDPARKPNRKETIRALRAAFEANARSFERLETATGNLETLFRAVSDRVFVFSGESLELANAAAERLLAEAGGAREPILRALARIGRTDPEELPVRMEFAADGRPLFLEVRRTSAFFVQDAEFRLLTVEDKTREEMLAAECARIAAEERRRIGRRLHDGLAQSLTSLSLQTTAFAYSETDPAKRRRWEEIAAIADHCLRAGGALTRKLENG